MLDFRNDIETITEAFQRYYEAVIVEPTDTNILYDLRARIMNGGILDEAEIEAASDAFFGVDPEKRSLKAIYANVDPAVVRFSALADEDQAELRDALDRFIRAYAFLSQVMPWTDATLERLYVYAKALAACLPAESTGGLDLGSDLVLTHLRLENTAPASIELEDDAVEPGKPFPGEGHAATPGDPRLDNLAAVLNTISERFGADLDDTDRLEVEAIKVALLKRDDLKSYAAANTEENYALEFRQVFKSAILGQEERNRRLYELLLGKPELAKMIERELMRATYQELRAREGPPRNS